jgi:hypothetical protein
MAGGAPPVYRPGASWSAPPGGFTPSESGGAGQGFARVGARPYQVDPSTMLGWQPPPPPPGTYNPIRDQELAAGNRETEQAIGRPERERTVAENDYGTRLGLLGQREAREQEVAKQTLARLAEGYAKLGTRQNERANQLGIVGGGAMIASATKRAANEGVQKAADERAFAQQRQADENERGSLATHLSQLVGPGGSLVEAIQNAQANRQLSADNINAFKASEAGQHGYKGPQRPWAGGPGGWYRVGGPH